MEREFVAELDSLYPILGFVQSEVCGFGFSELAAQEIELAVEELFVNIVNYAYTDKVGLVIIDCREPQEGKVVITLKDQGIPFNPLVELQKHPKKREMLKHQKGGFGIFIAISIMDRVDYRRDNDWNVLILEKSNQPCLSANANRKKME
ncbi:MAG: ATP-binding protein [Waddliaceae bacterium]